MPKVEEELTLSCLLSADPKGREGLIAAASLPVLLAVVEKCTEEIVARTARRLRGEDPRLPDDFDEVRSQVFRAAIEKGMAWPRKRKEELGVLK